MGLVLEMDLESTFGGIYTCPKVAASNDDVNICGAACWILSTHVTPPAATITVGWLSAQFHSTISQCRQEIQGSISLPSASWHHLHAASQIAP